MFPYLISFISRVYQLSQVFPSKNIDFVRKALYYFFIFMQLNYIKINQGDDIMAVTISDVAQRAGVSTSTVSKVLNNWSTISDQTKEKVMKAVEELNYIPNSQAVSFARGATRNIIFLSSFERESAYNNPHMFEIMCGCRDKLAQNGYSLILADITQGTSPDQYINQLIGSRTADGILIHGSSYHQKMAKPLVVSKFPHIVIGSLTNSSVSWIDTDNALAGQFAAHYIIKCDYERIAYIGYNKGFISAQRLNGFLGGLYEFGYRIPDEYIGVCEVNVDSAERCTHEILKLKKRPQVLVCENNIIALGAVKAIKQANIKMPTEISVVTFDSFPYSKLIDPIPTIIDIDMYDLGSQAADLLLRKIENPALHIQTHTALPVVKQGK